MRIRRRRICFVQIADELMPDLGALFRGDLKLESEPSAELLCPVSGERLRVTPRELAVLAQMVAGEWVDADAFLAQTQSDPDDLRDMLQRHVVLSDHEDDAFSRQMIEAETRFEEVGWFDLTAMYHAMTRWKGVANDESNMEHTPEAHRDRLNVWVGERGALAPHFPQREDAIAHHPLQLPAFDSPLAEILKARRTTRAFMAEQVLPQQELAYVLYGCFGAQGIRDLAPGVTAVKRTSASGGGLTPIDPYPIILRVEGLPSGIYHYDMGRHALELLVEKTEQELREFMMEITAGQDYFTQMQAAVVHVARFNRHHWKYRQHAKAYKALLMDSAHLSQTFYLLATERKLGAYYTAAINDADIGTYLGLNPIEAAPIGISGLGIRASEANHALHFNPEPFTPE